VKKKWIFIFMVILVFFGYIFLAEKINFESKDKSYNGEIEFETTIIGYEPSNKGVKFNLFNSNQKEINQVNVPYSNNERDLITPLQNKNAYFLIQSTDDSKNDSILDLETRKVQDIGWRGHSVVAENEQTILLAKYKKNQWVLTKYDKKSGNIEDTKFQENYPDPSGVRVHNGLFNDNKWYIPYSSSHGTFAIILDGNTYTKVSISNQELSDLWIINSSNDGFTFYSGYIGATNEDSVSFMDPKLNQVNINNEDVNVSSIPIDNISNNAYCLGFYKKDDSNYLMLFKTQGNTKLETILLDANGKSEKVFKSPEMDIQSVKINQSIIAVANYNEAIFLDHSGNFVKKIETN